MKEKIEALINSYEEYIAMDKDVIAFAMNSGEVLAINARIKAIEAVVEDLKQLIV